VVSSIGLQLGHTVTRKDLIAANERLVKTGYFLSSTFQYRYNNDELQVPFIVKENNRVFPCVFDNFIWFSQEEINSAIKSVYPSYQGKAPESGTRLDDIAQALTGLLKQRQLPGTVDYILAVRKTGKSRAEHLFSVKGVSIPICSLQFQGVSGRFSQLLMQNSQSLLNTDYSNAFIQSFVENNLKKLYLKEGYWRVNLNELKARLITERQNCQGGVEMSFLFEEGPVYHWASARWVGNQLLSSKELDQLLAMKSGEVAGSKRIDEGVEAIRKAYGKKGHLIFQSQFTPVFTDSSSDLVVEFRIAEGPQFHMGKLKVTGLSEISTQRFIERWKLLPNAVYDDSYLASFLRNDFLIFARDNEKRKYQIFNIRQDLKSLTVDVDVNFR
jgi:outer membrane protein assembly factor BamA